MLGDILVLELIFNIESMKQRLNVNLEVFKHLFNTKHSLYQLCFIVRELILVGVTSVMKAVY